ncbi:MAG: potassium channel family protein [Candidatus Thiodiazotropha sp. (ex Epidulcina cf. delphinae)]|nr:potassium channel family protein [Candidatus Thiodiazotropha sp. (ex Epidulcina cf. delphinae)]
MAVLKAKLYLLLEATPRNTRGQRAFDLLLVGLILGNVLAVILGSVHTIETEYQTLFVAFELLSVALFTLELLLRLWVSDLSENGSAGLSRRRFWFNPYTWTDILAVAPFYLGFLISMDLRLLRLLRLFRVFRISPYFRSLALLGSVIKQEYRPMLSALSVIIILMLFAAGGIYLLEREGQPEAFGDLPPSLWWVVVTLSTVGYGDAVPLTWLGRTLGAVIMLLGVGMVALPAGMLASRFSQVMHRQQNLFRRLVEQNIEAGNPVSEAMLEPHRIELFISRTEARSIIANCIEESQRPLNFCPECGSRLPGHRTA